MPLKRIPQPRLPATGRLYGKVRRILESAQAGAARSVNTAQVVANWMVGCEIVEEEQKGRHRAGYAERLVAQLSEQLTSDYGAGYSVQSLWYMRQFYLGYPDLLPQSPSGTALPPAGIPFSNILHTPCGELKQTAGVASLLPSRRRAGVHNPEILHTLYRESELWKPGLLHPGLSWSHYRTLLRVDRESARAFYEIESARHAWSARELARQIDSLLYDRLIRSKDKKGLMKLAARGQDVSSPLDIFKDPTVIEFLGLPESPRLVESTLEQALIDNLQHFLLELGAGFAFVGRQQRVTLDGDHFYIDLVFYHTVLKCYILVDLKVGKLTHSDLGQLQFYVNYFDRERCTTGDNPTLGLILCSDKNDAVVRYTLGEGKQRKIFTSRYQLHLPTEKVLRNEIQREALEIKATQKLLPARAASVAVSPGKKTRGRKS